MIFIIYEWVYFVLSGVVYVVVEPFLLRVCVVVRPILLWVVVVVCVGVWPILLCVIVYWEILFIVSFILQVLFFFGRGVCAYSWMFWPICMYLVFRCVNFSFICCCLCVEIISSVGVLCFFVCLKKNVCFCLCVEIISSVGVLCFFVLFEKKMKNINKQMFFYVFHFFFVRVFFLFRFPSLSGSFFSHVVFFRIFLPSFAVLFP